MCWPHVRNGRSDIVDSSLELVPDVHFLLFNCSIFIGIYMCVYKKISILIIIFMMDVMLIVFEWKGCC